MIPAADQGGFAMFEMILRRSLCRALLGLVAALSATAPAWAHAQDLYPSRALRLIVPAAAAGPTDFLARIAADHLSKALQQNVIVENLPGAGGNVGLQAAARAAPDGYSLFIGSQSMMAMGPYLFRQLPFDHERDFTPVFLMASPPYVLVVNPAIGVRRLEELLALLRAQPGRFNFASTGGNGSTSHVVGELFKRSAGVDLVHVPYKGDAQASADLIAGQVQMMFSLSAAVTPHIQAGRLRAIAIGSTRRIAALPEVSTFDESGLPGFTAASWFAIWTRAGVPAPIVERLNAALNTMLEQPEVRSRLESVGSEPAGGSVSQVQSFVRSEREKWGKVIREAGIRLD
jgi:tripartite-type tricarboxylate transporter receptor subunit TctC